MEWVIISLIGLVAIIVWAVVRLADTALAWKITERFQESQVDANLQALVESLKEND